VVALVGSPPPVAAFGSLEGFLPTAGCGLEPVGGAIAATREPDGTWTFTMDAIHSYCGGVGILVYGPYHGPWDPLKGGCLSSAVGPEVLCLLNPTGTYPGLNYDVVEEPLVDGKARLAFL
jgi:hypothetical protein